MPLTFANILQPGGDVEPKLFPHLSQAELESRITSYLTEGGTRAADLAVVSTDVERYTIAWTYYRTYFSIYSRLIGTPAKATIAGQGDRTYDPKQAQAFLDLANDWKAIADGLVPPEEATTPARPESASFPNRYVF